MNKEDIATFVQEFVDDEMDSPEMRLGIIALLGELQHNDTHERLWTSLEHV